MKPEDMTILTVDDTPANIRLLTHYLEKQGYNVITAEDGFEGFKAAIQHHPDLVLLDIMMPGTDGYEVCELLKAEEETKDIPVVFLTAKTDVEDKVRGFELGAVDYITKPFNLVEIATRVQTQLHYKYLQRQIKRFYQIFSQNVDSPSFADVALDMAGGKLNTVVNAAQKRLQKGKEEKDSGSQMKAEFEKVIQEIQATSSFINSVKTSQNSRDWQYSEVDLNLLLEDIIDILNNQEDNTTPEIQYTCLAPSAVVTASLSHLQSGLLNFFVAGIDIYGCSSGIKINLKETELPEALHARLEGEPEEHYCCIEIASKSLQIKKEDLKNDLNALLDSDAPFNFKMIHLQSMMQMYRGVIDVCTEDSKETKVFLYLPKS